MSYSRQLADFVRATRFDDIPDPVTARAKQLLIDTLGVGLAGSRHPNAVRALAGIRAIPGAGGDHPVIGSDVSLTAPYAALVNGVACHALDFDDTHTESIVHGSAILTPLSLALAEEISAPGRAVLTAFVVGWEVAARIGIASGNGFHKRGFHSTAIAGIFGALAAAGKLLALSSEQLTHGFGLCGSQAAGITEFLSNNSAAKGYHVGWAAHNAMMTAYLCRSGATGPATVFEGRNGLFNTHGLPDRCAAAATVSELGRRWEIGRVSIKPYPCCHFAHGAVGLRPRPARGRYRRRADRHHTCRYRRGGRRVRLQTDPVQICARQRLWGEIQPSLSDRLRVDRRQDQWGLFHRTQHPQGRSAGGGAQGELRGSRTGRHRLSRNISPVI